MPAAAVVHNLDCCRERLAAAAAADSPSRFDLSRAYNTQYQSVRISAAVEGITTDLRE